MKKSLQDSKMKKDGDADNSHTRNLHKKKEDNWEIRVSIAKKQSKELEEKSQGTRSHCKTYLNQ